MSLDNQIEFQVNLATIENNLNEVERILGDMYKEALTEMIDNIGIMDIMAQTYKNHLLRFKNQCINYGKLLGSHEGIQ